MNVKTVVCGCVLLFCHHAHLVILMVLLLLNSFYIYIANITVQK